MSPVCALGRAGASIRRGHVSVWLARAARVWRCGWRSFGSALAPPPLGRTGHLYHRVLFPCLAPSCFFFFCFRSVALLRFAPVFCRIVSFSSLYWGARFALRSSTELRIFFFLFKLLLSRGAGTVYSLPIPITQAGVRSSWELCPWASLLNCRWGSLPLGVRASA